ncbi:hypothetical protein V1L54_11565 [Streptomyces sp. TRM 70361]|uniref:hypothetical protein n=1 Tax=Streptomyces sp. TRM 70361 TaxID=3116553 RepID=UPI002E7AD911|nr:hypothetical protein [Streptomyces sp. TRM 70361]MEE1940025.1 hypothetical protein [Streptomyces sp. TRM 70361]
MRLRLNEFRPRIGPHEYRVVQPRTPLRHTTLSDPLKGWGYLLGDHDGLSRLAALFSFAAFSRHTVVHVPLRRSLPRQVAPGVPVGLVLVHRSPGLRPYVWPQLRRRLTRGTPLTVRTDERRTAAHADAWRCRWEDHWYRMDVRDRIRPAVHARTLFLYGGRDVFASACVHLELAADFGPLQEGVDRGRDVLVTSLTTHLPLGHGPWPKLDIGFQARPSYRHFRPPGRSARYHSPA